MARKPKVNLVSYTPEQVEEIREMLVKKFSSHTYLCLPERMGGSDVWELKVHNPETLEYLPEHNFKVRLIECENGWITSMAGL
jgi:hypothetical protein